MMFILLKVTSVAPVPSIFQSVKPVVEGPEVIGVLNVTMAAWAPEAVATAAAARVETRAKDCERDRREVGVFIKIEDKRENGGCISSLNKEHPPVGEESSEVFSRRW